MSKKDDEQVHEYEDQLNETLRKLEHSSAAAQDSPGQTGYMDDGRPVIWGAKGADGSQRGVIGFGAFTNTTTPDAEIKGAPMQKAYALVDGGDAAQVAQGLAMADHARAHSTDPQERIESAMVVKRSGMYGLERGEQAIDISIKGLSDPDPKVRAAYLQTMGNYRYYKDGADPAKDARASALEDKAIDALRTASHDSDTGVRMETMRQLYQFSYDSDFFNGPSKTSKAALSILSDMEKHDNNADIRRGAKYARLDTEDSEASRKTNLSRELAANPGETRADWHKKLDAQPKM